MGKSICDLCGDSVPGTDLEEGLAYRRGPRLICHQCDRAMGGGGPVQEKAAAARRWEKKRDPNVGLWAVVSATVLVAGWGLWEAQEARSQNAKLLDRLEAWESQQVRTLAQQEERQMQTGQERVTSLQAEIRAGDAESRKALDAPLANLDTRMKELRTEIAAQDGASEEQVQALAQRMEAWQAEWQTLESALARLEEDHSASVQAGQSDRMALAHRIDSLEKVSGPEMRTPTGVQAAPWFAITADLQHEQVAIRLDAVYSLEQSHDVRICAYLRPLLQDSDSLIRLAVARILAEHRFRPAAPDLIAGLEDPVLSVRDGFIKALRHITGRQFGFRADGRETERKRPLESWQAWWQDRGDAFLQGEPG